MYDIVYDKCLKHLARLLQSVTIDDNVDMVTSPVCGCTQCQPCKRTSSPVNTPGDDGNNE